MLLCYAKKGSWETVAHLTCLQILPTIFGSVNIIMI